MTELTETGDLWRDLPPMKDAESCVGAGVTWAIKLARPDIPIPTDVEERINIS